MTGTDTGKLAAEPVWRRYLTDYNEGLGLVYERLDPHDYLEGLKHRFGLSGCLRLRCTAWPASLDQQRPSGLAAAPSP